jgi:hypothetical protein
VIQQLGQYGFFVDYETIQMFHLMHPDHVDSSKRLADMLNSADIKDPGFY